MNLTERLRSVVRPSSGGSAAHATCGPDLADADPAYSDTPSETLDGEWRESRGERYVVIDRSYPPGHRHGRAVLADSAPDGECGWPALAVLEPSIGESRVLFIDLETTGLAGGAGTYADGSRAQRSRCGSFCWLGMEPNGAFSRMLPVQPPLQVRWSRITARHLTCRCLKRGFCFTA